MSSGGRTGGLAGGLGVSAAVHLTIIALAIWGLRPGPPVVLPPIYKVNIVAAPPGPRAIGEVTTAPAPAHPAPVPPRMREAPSPVPPAPTKAAPTPITRATPTEGKPKPTTATKAPKAGGGPVGGRGTDVATVQTAGIDFPFPGYLNNIVRQIALNFKPRNPNSPLSATVSFLIHRDGTVTNVKFLTRSGVYSFDLEAQGAVERASSAFGPLPNGFRDDVLPVVFSFDPRFLQ
ncbi:MAG: TonB family protein [Gemmatimonadota bacterium]|nr:TonB family protein [Gemmatimonadota bacterium]